MNQLKLEEIINYEERVLEFLKRELEKEIEATKMANISESDNFTHMPEAEAELEFDDNADKKVEEDLTVEEDL